MTLAKRAQRQILRRSQGKFWEFSGNEYQGWLELITNKNMVRYMKKEDYENTWRYPMSIPIFKAERLIEDGVKIE